MDNYLIHGTNALSGSLKYTTGDEFRYDKKSVELYMSFACKTLEMLLNDEETLSSIAQGIGNNSETKYHHFRDFVKEFSKPDKALLIAAGMRKRTADYLFSDLKNIRNVLNSMERNSRQDLGQNFLRERIRELRNDACDENNFTKKKKWEYHVPYTLRRVIHVIGGGSIVVTNVSADMVIGGIASAFSQGYGGHLVMKGIEPPKT